MTEQEFIDYMAPPFSFFPPFLPPSKPRLHTNVESFIKLQDWRQQQLENLV
jgi:hypothetical protein